MDKHEMERFILGSTWEEAVRTPTFDELLAQMSKELFSNYPLISLGMGEAGDFWISEEDRESHLEIIGTTGEGKSKFLEGLMKNDLERGHGFILLDPSTGFETGKNVLKHCAKMGIEKIIVIDPTHRWSHEKVIALSPFILDRSLVEASVGNMTDVLRIVFGTKDPSDTPQINKSLPAVLHVLHEKKLSLYETLYFTDFSYTDERREILNQDNRHASYLRSVCFNPVSFDKEVGSTTRRLEPILHGILSLMFAIEGLDFTKIVREGYIVLVNLSSFRLEPLHNRLLGITIIDLLVFAIDRMFENGWKGVYYLYLDEAGEFANRKLAHLLAYKRKTGLRLNLAHQYDAQFEDKYVLDAVRNLTKIKIAFFIPNVEDRLRFIKNAFGGSLDDRDVSYVLSQQKKQHLVVKKGKEAAASIRAHDIETPDINTDSYIEKILSQPFYHSPKEIQDVIYQRANSLRTPRGTRTKHRANHPSHGGQRKQRANGAEAATGRPKTDQDNSTQPKTDPFTLAEELERAKRNNDQA
jgi:hypothetical protein